MADLKRHRAELDPKFHYLADAPEKDDEGNAAMIRFNRKTREHYLSSTRNGEPSGWTAHFVGDTWVTKKETQAKPEPAKKGRHRR